MRLPACRAHLRVCTKCHGILLRSSQCVCVCVWREGGREGGGRGREIGREGEGREGDNCSVNTKTIALSTLR